MAELSGSAPLRNTSWSAPRVSEQVTKEGAAARAARLYNRELGELNRQSRVAQQKGEVVTEAAIELEFGAQGHKLIAVDASSTFKSREPVPTPFEKTVVEARPAAQPDQDSEAASPAEVVAVRDQLVQRVSLLQQALTHGQPSPPETDAGPAALDETA